MKNKVEKENIFDFCSCRIAYYDFNLESECSNILGQLDINELFFFKKSLRDKTNNKGGKFQIYNSTLLEIEKKYHIEPKYLTSTINGVFFNNRDTSIIPLEIFNEVFDIPFYVKYYEGIYNTFNYIKNTIYMHLNEDKNNSISKDILFKDYYQKQCIAYSNLEDIVEYLNSINSECILKSSVCDDILINNIKNNLNKSVLAEAIAFGTTLEKLESNNYEDSKRLLYLPSHEWTYRKR